MVIPRFLGGSSSPLLILIPLVVFVTGVEIDVV
jgi:hypothetical protein